MIPRIVSFLSLRSNSVLASALSLGVDAYVSTIRLCNSLRGTFLMFSVFVIYSALWWSVATPTRLFCANKLLDSFSIIAESS